MLKRLLRRIKSLFYSIPFGMKAGDEIIATSSIDSTNGSGVHQVKKQNSVWADLLQGKITQEVEALRYTMYLAEEKSNEYEYLGNGLSKGKVNDITVRNFKMNNIELDYGFLESTNLLEGKNKYDAIYMPTRRLLNIEYNNPTKYNVSNCVDSFKVNFNNEPYTIKLYIGDKSYACPQKKLYNDLKKIKDSLVEIGNTPTVKNFIKKQDILSDIKEIDFITHEASNNIPNGIHYKLTDLTFKEITFDYNDIVLLFHVGKLEDGELLSDKFYCKEQDMRYKNKEAKNDGVILDFNSINESMMENGGFKVKNDFDLNIGRHGIKIEE